MKLNIGGNELHLKPGLNSGAPEGWVVRAPLLYHRTKRRNKSLKGTKTK